MPKRKISRDTPKANKRRAKDMDEGRGSYIRREQGGGSVGGKGNAKAERRRTNY